LRVATPSFRSTKIRNTWRDQRIKRHGGWKFETVEVGQGHKTADLQPPFYVRISANGSRSWKHLLADTFAAAKAEADRIDGIVEAAASGLTLKEAEDIANKSRVPVKKACDDYLFLKRNKSPKTVAQYRTVLTQFLESLPPRVKFLDQITVDVLRGHMRFMESEGYAGKTIDTRVDIVSFMLKKNGVAARVPKDEKPVVETEQAVAFNQEQLDKLFAAANGDRLAFEFFLATGCREQEVTFASWSDIDFKHNTYTVRRKPEVGFTPKNHESRTIPLKKSLVDALREHRKHGDARWLFVTEQGKPEGHFLRKLKKAYWNAKLNCGHCHAIEFGKEVSCATRPVCEHVYLHKFRKTRATRWLESGLTLRDVQVLLGHKDLSTTQKYLAASDPKTLQAKIESGD
jgi:integrase/recombinase XerD